MIDAHPVTRRPQRSTPDRVDASHVVRNALSLSFGAASTVARTLARYAARRRDSTLDLVEGRRESRAVRKCVRPVAAVKQTSGNTHSDRRPTRIRVRAYRAPPPSRGQTQPCRARPVRFVSFASRCFFTSRGVGADETKRADACNAPHPIARPRPRRRGHRKRHRVPRDHRVRLRQM